MATHMANESPLDRTMSGLETLKFFQAPSHDCSYLSDRSATTVFADPSIKVDTRSYTLLSQIGFRRSGPHIYKPMCAECNACVPVRVLTGLFAPKRRHRRLQKRNQDLTAEVTQPNNRDEVWALYARYITLRHFDGDMYPPSRDQFVSFLVEGREEARFIEYRLRGRLAAVAVIDQLQDSLSAIYTFFDPDLEARSLGSYAIIDIIQRAVRSGLPYVYLGYWIEDSAKMRYKAEFLPQQRLIDNAWHNVEP